MKKEILDQVEFYVESNMASKNDDIFMFHNKRHTKKVVKVAKEICEFEGVSKETRDKILCACWFHDIAYKKNSDNHEQTSAEMAEEFLIDRKVSEEDIEEIKELINATKMPQKPRNKEQEIICDADLSHLGTPNFYEESDRLRHEQTKLLQVEKTELEWTESNINFFQQHQYYTSYAKLHFQGLKESHLLELENYKTSLLQPKSIDSVQNPPTSPFIKSKDSSKNEVKEKEKSTSRGVQTFFRTTAQSHIQLSQIADQKAGMLITVNAIIISIFMASLDYQNDQTFSLLILPLGILALFSTGTIILSVIATRPQFTEGKFELADVLNNNTNLLFFGNFHNMSLPSYEQGVQNLIENESLLYSSMIKDIFYIGQVLGKKYNRLRNAYTVFMVGLILSLATLVIILVST
ncbi:MAG: HD domain-containing protein [Saprospiraceae bacterium]|nr:HD domain-containing protein [Saprospiraceae bacterium]MBL0294834.1 HD domain-containing protein [Saprospiraceae bacterium]